MNGEETTEPAEAVAAEMRGLLQRAELGDEAVLPALRSFLDARPDLWRALSDLGRRAEEALLGLVGDNLLAREALSRRLVELKKELAGPEATAPVRLLAERVALCWLEVQLAELDAAAFRQGGPVDKSLAQEADRRLGRAHRRYLTAHRQLVLTSKLTQPGPSPVDAATPVVGGGAGGSPAAATQ